ILDDALAGHRRYTGPEAAPLDVAARDARRIEQWMRDHLGLLVRIPARTTRGEVPEGARVTTVGGHPAAHVVYGGDGRQLSLFVARTPREPLPEEGEHVVDGAEVYARAVGGQTLGWWQDRHHLFVAVVPATEDDLIALAAQCLRGQRGLAAAAPGFTPTRPNAGRALLPVSSPSSGRMG
ncbi:MAG TPA: hypothetical protein VKD67_13915, partial [Acidimicrobiales bacterium]|nr:hypothetical protein [Acidimicrobiales bacterium]